MPVSFIVASTVTGCTVVLCAIGMKATMRSATPNDDLAAVAGTSVIGATVAATITASHWVLPW
jgi:hypothetical protein